MTPVEKLRAAIQELLDAEGDGWIVNEYVVALGLEKIDASGHIESTAWVWAPSEQPEWVSDGLLQAAVELREHSGIDTE
jgi:hypothetical protein